MASHTPALPIGIAFTSMTAGSVSPIRVPFSALRLSGIGDLSALAEAVAR